MQARTLKKKDAIRGLQRIDGYHVYDSDLAAPIFAIAFEMEDKTALPDMVRKAVWLLSNAYACIQKGEEGAHIKGIDGLELVTSLQPGMEKVIIVQENGNGEKVPLEEMRIQLRIHEVKGDNDALEHYIVLLVFSPLAFSIRKAVWKTLQSKGRGFDAQDVEIRRSMWNLLATHVRQASADTAAHTQSAMAGLYTADDLTMAHSAAVDWCRVSNSQSFTSLFNVNRTVDWIAHHFFKKHTSANTLVAEGFGVRDRSSECMTPAFIAQCIQYDKDVDAAIDKTYGKKKKKARTNVPEEPLETIISVPAPFQGSGEEDEAPLPGYPYSDICMDVYMPTHMDNFPSYAAFWSHCKGFPTSVTLDLLRKSLLLDVSIEDGVECELLTLLENNAIVRGEETILNRPMLAGGDVFWGSQCRRSLEGMPTGAEKVTHLRKIMRLSLALGLTRAAGSDVYENKRVAAYGKFMTHAEESKQECRETFQVLVENVVAIRQGCPVYEAMQMFTHVIYESNTLAWHLRPDNLYLVIQLLVSDIMLCLNYFDSMIGGAANGIGATVCVRDGGGSYRTLHKEMGDVNMVMKQIFHKNNGSGADMCVGIHKLYTSLRSYVERLAECDMDSCFSELKRTTELGLLQECCNIIEHGSNDVLKQTHTVKDTASRRYSTELKASNDLQSQCCMTAVSWLVTRNTMGLDLNRFATTKEDDKNKGRMAVEYRQVIYGYWVICSNAVGLMSRERYRTMLTVSRSIASAANGIATHQRDTADVCMVSVNDDKEAESKRAARPLYFATLCTAITSGFLQWTGVLGKLPSSPCLEAILEIFYAHLSKCHCMLNPDSYSQGDRGRCVQISKARGVAMSLIITAMEQTLDAGRAGAGQQEAIENTSMRLMMESMTPHSAPWIMGDTLEHMFRTDFVILMQLLAQKLGVPVNIELAQVLQWLRTGNMEHCDAPLQTWWNRQERVVASPMNDTRVGSAEIADCFYLTNHELQVNLLVPAGSGSDILICQHIGRKLFSQNTKLLQENCQIHASSGGEDVITCMLLGNANIEMEWPSVLGDLTTLPHFWLDRATQASTCLMPVRFIMISPKIASVCVDARWLLLYCGLCGTVPSQSSRFLGVARWIDYFYHLCIPPRMVCSPSLFTGLPSPIMDAGLLMVPYRASNRRTLLRAPYMMQTTGLNAPIRSTAVEDLGPAALRYQLAKVLQVNERDIPTDAVSYSFPMDMWCPVLAADGHFGSIKWQSHRGFVLRFPNAREQTVQAGDYLGGRVDVDIRPLCMFDRSGVVVCLPSLELGVLLAYDPDLAAYRVVTASGDTVLLDPYEFEDAVVPIGGELFMVTSAFPERERYRFIGAESMLLACKLSIPLDDTEMVAVSVNVDLRGQEYSSSQYGSSHGSYQRSKQRKDFMVAISNLLPEALDGVRPHTSIAPC